MSGDVMNGLGTHEDNAQEAVYDNKPEVAQVFAILALAAAVNRLADTQENTNS